MGCRGLWPPWILLLQPFEWRFLLTVRPPPPGGPPWPSYPGDPSPGSHSITAPFLSPSGTFYLNAPAFAACTSLPQHKLRQAAPHLPCSVSRPLELWSPTCLAPGPGFVGDSFSRDGRPQVDGWFRDDSDTVHRLCASLLTYCRRWSAERYRHPRSDERYPCPQALVGTEVVINIYLIDE